jgi:hypothetical protein
VASQRTSPAPATSTLPPTPPPASPNDAATAKASVKAAKTERKRIRALEERTQRWEQEESAADDLPNPNDAPTAERPERPTTGVKWGRNKAQTSSSGNIAVVAEAIEAPTVKLTKRQRNSQGEQEAEEDQRSRQALAGVCG